MHNIIFDTSALETNDSQIIHERLEYILTKNKEVYFDITPEQITISPTIFLEKSAYQEIKLTGKHQQNGK